MRCHARRCPRTVCADAHPRPLVGAASASKQHRTGADPGHRSRSPDRSRMDRPEPTHRRAPAGPSPAASARHPADVFHRRPRDVRHGRGLDRGRHVGALPPENGQRADGCGAPVERLAALASSAGTARPHPHHRPPPHQKVSRHPYLGFQSINGRSPLTVVIVRLDRLRLSRRSNRTLTVFRGAPMAIFTNLLRFLRSPPEHEDYGR